MGPDVSPDRRRKGLTILVGAVLALVVASVSLILGWITAPADIAPSTRSAEAGFARDMQTHHQQAVEMSMIVRDLTDDPDVRLLAYDIATSQAQQAGQMFGWLAVWGLPQASPEPAMTWMQRPGANEDGHSAHGAAAGLSGVPDIMPGMATQEQLQELRSLRGVAAERLFLQLMIAHHQGGVEMAEALLNRSSNSTVTTLATSIINAQKSEIELMQSLLAQRENAGS